MVNLVDIVNKLGSEGARWARRVKQEADYLSKLDHVSPTHGSHIPAPIQSQGCPLTSRS